MLFAVQELLESNLATCKTNIENIDKDIEVCLACVDTVQDPNLCSCGHAHKIAYNMGVRTCVHARTHARMYAHTIAHTNTQNMSPHLCTCMCSSAHAHTKTGACEQLWAPYHQHIPTPLHNLLANSQQVAHAIQFACTLTDAEAIQHGAVPAKHVGSLDWHTQLQE